MKRLLVIPLIATLAACNNVKKPFEGRSDPYPPGQISFASQMLQDQTAVGTPIATRDDAGNILYVTIPIRSTTNEQLYVDYRVTFFDRNGQSITDNGWQTRLLTSNIPDNIKVMSGNSRAADFHIDFRPAR
jgi:hypothetical protein